MSMDENLQPVRREPRRRPGLAQVAVPALAVGSGALTALALTQLVPIDGALDIVKVVLIGGSAMMVSVTINRFAIERGAELAARGYLAAGIVSVGSMLVVGCGLAAATYSGLVIKDVDGLRLQEHGADLARSAAEANRASAAAAQSASVTGAIVSNLRTTTDCEVANSCLSGRHDGGRGPVARALGEVLGKAEAVAAEVEHGRAARDEAQHRLNDDLSRYQATLAGSDQDGSGRRRQLADLDGRIKQDLVELDAAAPTPLLRAYAAELSSGSTTAASPRLARILRDHGNALAGTLSPVGTEAPSYPPFPAKTGVADTLRYIPTFLPIAAVAIVVDLVLPVVLWTLRLLGLLWANYRVEWWRARHQPSLEPDDDDPSIPPHEAATPRLTAEEWQARFPPPPRRRPVTSNRPPRPAR